MVSASLLDMTALAHPSWHATLCAGLAAIDHAHPDYLAMLVADDYLPTEGRMFATFAQPMDLVRYVLVGEGPYPRAASATGVCFMDGAVTSLWSDKGLSKQVNRATSLRNFMKMLLVADGQINVEKTSGNALESVSTKMRTAPDKFVQTLPELQDKLIAQGFLLLNATLVFRSTVSSVHDAKAWLPFLQVVLAALIEHAELANQPPPTLVLWGKIAVQLEAVPANRCFPKQIAEHPYNLSFIANHDMQALFAPMHLLKK